MLLRNERGQIVGTLVDGILQKTVNSKKHRLHFMNAYAVDVDLIKQVLEQGCRAIEILEKDTGDLYRIETDDFIKHAKIVDFGHGEQYAVNVGKWQYYPNGQGKLL